MKQKEFFSHTDVEIDSSEWDILPNSLTRPQWKKKKQLQGELSHIRKHPVQYLRR